MSENFSTSIILHLNNTSSLITLFSNNCFTNWKKLKINQCTIFFHFAVFLITLCFNPNFRNLYSYNINDYKLLSKIFTPVTNTKNIFRPKTNTILINSRHVPFHFNTLRVEKKMLTRQISSTHWIRKKFFFYLTI